MESSPGLDEAFVKEAMEGGSIANLLKIEEYLRQRLAVQTSKIGLMVVRIQRIGVPADIARVQGRISDSLRALGIGGPTPMNLLTAGPDAEPDYFMALGVVFGFLMLCAAVRYLIARMRRHERPGPIIEEVKETARVRCPHIAVLGAAPSLVVGGPLGVAYCVRCHQRGGSCPMSENLFFMAVKMLGSGKTA